VNERVPRDATVDAGDRDAEHVRARVAWYYYVGGLTQQEIADKLGITRLRVNRIVGQARADGLVQIDIRMPLARCVALEERLRERYGLAEVSVVPTLDDDAELQRVVGEAAGVMLDPLLRDGQGLGVGWGRTLSAALKRLTARRFSRGWVATLMGGLTRGSGTNTFEVSTGFAKVLGSECYYLAVPIYFPSPESRDALMQHYGIAEAYRRARLADIALVSCGDTSTRSLLVSTQIVTENIAELRAAGAVGDLLGVFLDAEGRPVEHPLNRRVMALSPFDLKAIPNSILASGGQHKAPVIRAVLTGGYVKRLVTDEACAEAVLG
jgi:DNA-binding transcriptional regulator LsrR (DeoR family)